MSWKLTLEDIDQYKSAFAVCDKDHDGLISVNEVGKIMRKLGKNFSEQEFDIIIKNIKTENEGFVELHEFLNLMAENKNDENTLRNEQTQLIEAFSYFDRDGSGTIDYAEFKHVLTSISEKLNDREIARLDALASTLRKQVELLEKELRSTAQRVNLFEKVKIPEAKENIRVIGIYLGDQQTSAVVRGKIAKKKLQGAAS